MNKVGRLAIIGLALGAGLLGQPGVVSAAGASSRTFNAPIEKVWTVTESTLKSLGWDIDKSDRAVGWMVTDSRSVDFKDYAVYGKGLRHKLRVALKASGDGRTIVSVERELYTEERILWMIERKPLEPPDQAVELGVLDAIQQLL
jgi:hypothetical protein